MCRTISAVANDDEALARVSAARRLAREAVWAAGGEPPAVAAASAHEADGGVGGGDVGEPLAIDLDATISIAHSDDKDGAGATYKGTWGFHPMLAYLDRGDGTSEALAGRLRPGNAGANNAGDRLAVFAEACWQLPELPAGLWRLVRADTAGASHAFLDAARQAGWAFSVGFPLSPEIKDAIRDLPEAAWTPAITQCGDLRPDAEVAELTDTVDLTGWPAGSRLIVRCEPLHPGAQQTLDYVEGCRFTAFLTDQPDQGLARLDARHRGHARVEDCIRCDKDTGLRTLPCDTLARNAVWLELILSAHDLINYRVCVTAGNFPATTCGNVVDNCISGYKTECLFKVESNKDYGDSDLMCTKIGDSGSPHFAYAVAYGIHNNSPKDTACGGWVKAEHAGEAAREMNVDILTS
ncbi:MAG: hypothetical protein BRC32_02455 [Actinobacteria bacterium QS_8_72_14]|nr:MAG: hypothetical protein BRC32_02455 [Actinobacteria bacterium QS_8_72_14]